MAIIWILLLILLIVIATKLWQNGIPSIPLALKNESARSVEGAAEVKCTVVHDKTGSADSEFEMFLVRHGQTDEAGALNEKGIEQASKTGAYLKNRFGKHSGDVVIYSSPTQSALDTAKSLQEALGTKTDIIQDERLAELDRGDGGKNFAEFPDLGQKLKDANASFAKKHPDPLDQHKSSDEYFALLQKTFGGEDIRKRLKDLRALVDEMHKHQHVIVVTHSGIIGLLAPDLVAVSQKGSYLTGDVRHGKHCTITYYDEKNGKPVLLVPTNSVHLANE
jgi:broad specificity phosphatase PhoE